MSHVPDMNHDEKITNEDGALFHEMLDDTAQQKEQTSQHNQIDWYAEIFIKAIFFLILLVFWAGILKGFVPVNAFTTVLGVLSIFCGIRILTL